MRRLGGSVQVERGVSRGQRLFFKFETYELTQ